MSYHLIARTYSCKGDFRTALQNEKEAYTIYKQVVSFLYEFSEQSVQCSKFILRAGQSTCLAYLTSHNL